MSGDDKKKDSELLKKSLDPTSVVSRPRPPEPVTEQDANQGQGNSSGNKTDSNKHD